MDRRTLLGMIAFGVASASAGAGVFAYFTDTASSSGNLFEAGLLDLRVNGGKDVGAFIGSGTLLPGKSVEGSVELRNDGTVGGADVDLDMAIDVTGAAEIGTGNLSEWLTIVDLTYGGTPLAVGDSNHNGRVDLDDWDRDNEGTRDLPDPGAGTALALRLRFEPSATNLLMGASANMTVRFRLAQVEADDLAETPSYSVLYVGSELDPRVAAILQDAGAATTVHASLPDDLSAYRVVIVESYGAATSEDAARLRDFVAAGGGALVTGGVPYLMCGGTGSVSCLGWFGSATYGNVGGGATAAVSVDGAFGTSLLASDPLVTGTRGPGGAGLTGWAGPAQEAAHWSGTDLAFTLVAENGTGRAAFSAGLSDAPDEYVEANAHAFFVGLIEWLAHEA